ncbi:MarR family winged helix-turn-helix transcriptional regulator [Streptomyces misionensis]|uniref:MarR family winged helix-turn-helix transcriptional regulator n=1 Tax=Streptomyces misionensis TaxID=67331 RepID=UPI0033BBE183
MSAQPRPDVSAPGPAARAPEARLLTEAVTRLRRALRSSIRTDYPWETLPMAQVELLQVLGEHSPARISDLAARRRLAPSTVSGLIGQMITAGLVARDVDSADRRASVVTLTDAGREKLAAWTTAHERRIDAALAALDDDSRTAIENALPALFRLAENLGGETGEGAREDTTAGAAEEAAGGVAEGATEGAVGGVAEGARER